jgi:uncharacterized protein DUF3305
MPDNELPPLPDGPAGVAVTVWYARLPLPGNPWMDHRWEVVALTPGADAEAPAGRAWVRRDCPPLQLHGDEAEGYLLNVEAAEPSLFLLVRSGEDNGEERGQDEPDAPPQVAAVSASFHEAARWIDGGAGVERLPLPAGWAEAIEAYARAHLKPPEEKQPKRRFAASGDNRDRPGH